MVSVDNIVLSVLAHPDDAEFLCAGTLIRLVREHGWRAHIASMTAGDCGSAELPPHEISRVRRAEGAAAAALINAEYHCLDERDLLVTYCERTLERVTRLIRQVRPRIVITHSPADYMLDHEMTSAVTRAAAFAAPRPISCATSAMLNPLPKCLTSTTATRSTERTHWAARWIRVFWSTSRASLMPRKRC